MAENQRRVDVTRVVRHDQCRTTQPLQVIESRHPNAVRRRRTMRTNRHHQRFNSRDMWPLPQCRRAYSSEARFRIRCAIARRLNTHSRPNNKGSTMGATRDKVKSVGSISSRQRNVQFWPRASYVA